MNITETLTKAADYIAVHGWNQGGWCHEGAVCARGAINAVVHGRPDQCRDYFRGDCVDLADQAAWALVDHLGIESEYHGDNIAGIMALGGWNDGLNRTADEVIAAMRECAASLTDGAPC